MLFRMKQKLMLAKAVVRVTEVVGILPLGPWTVRRWRARGNGPRYCRIVGRVFHKSDDVVDYTRSLPSGRGASVCSRSEAG
jgi:hypothetical protein